MMKKLASCAAGLFLALPAAHAQHKHVHGEGRIDVVIERDGFSVDLDLPLDTVVGFERAPRTEKEKAALAEAHRILQDAAALFLPTPAAQCVVRKTEVELPDFKDGGKDGGHAGIEAEYEFRCAAPAALQGIETTLFKSFKRLYRLEARHAGPAGQGAARLTPKNPLLGLTKPGA